MTRHLARGRQCRVGLLMREEIPLAGAVLIGRGAHSWLYLAVENEAEAHWQPLHALLAAMRRAMPARRIILPADLAWEGEGGLSLADLHLTSGARTTPRDLAGRAREAIRRSLSRLPRGGGGGLKPPRAGAA